MDGLRGYSKKVRLDTGILLNISTVSTYVFCPFKVFLQNYLGLREEVGLIPETGKVVHEYYTGLSVLLYEHLKAGKSLLKTLVDEYTETFLEKTPRDVRERVEEDLFRIAEFRLKQPFMETPVRREVYLSSRKLSLRGSIDLLEGIYPVEVKYRERIIEGDLIQLALYTLLLEETYRRDIDYGAIDLLKACKRVKVKVDSKLRVRALHAREKVLEATLAGQVENLKEKRRRGCKYCGLRETCRLITA